MGKWQKIVLWAPYTHWQTVLKGEVILRQKAYFGPDLLAVVIMVAISPE